MGRYCGKLRDFTAMELGAIASKEAIKRAGVDPKEFDHAVFGNAQQTSGDSLYGARHVVLRAGLPVEVPARNSSSLMTIILPYSGKSLPAGKYTVTANASNNPLAQATTGLL